MPRRNRAASQGASSALESPLTYISQASISTACEDLTNTALGEHDKVNQEILNSIHVDTFEDRAYGCILGAFIGDSVGSYVQFSTDIIDDETMDTVMEMNGGGPFGVGPG